MVSFEPAHDKWVIKKGTLFTMSYQYKNSSGTGIDLSSASGTVKIKSKDQTTTYLTLSTANGRISMDSSGNITFTILPADTATLTFTDLEDNMMVAVFDFYVTYSVSNVESLLEGEVKLRPYISS